MARGSKPGERRGGRKPGVPNRATLRRQEEVAASGLTPLDYLLSVMRDEAVPREERVDAANKVAPYVHPRLAAVAVDANLGVSDTLKEFMTHAAASGAASIMPADDGDD